MFLISFLLDAGVAGGGAAIGAGLAAIGAGVGIGQIGAFGFGRISSSCRAVMGMSFFR